MNDLFVLKDPLGKANSLNIVTFKFSVEYHHNRPTVICNLNECVAKTSCCCSRCNCCSVCAAGCSCLVAVKDPDCKVASILGFGDENYR